MNSQFTQITQAFTLANALSTQFITLAVALIGLTVTFAKDFRQNNFAWQVLLLVIWTFLFLSILCGIFDIKAIITTLAPQNPTDASLAFSDDALSWATRQELLFYLGLFLFIIHGVFSIFTTRK
jgi:hypothetical protein